MGYLDDTLDLAVTMLANVAAFRTWVVAADATAALDYLVKVDLGAAITKDRYAKLAIAADPDGEPGYGVFTRSGVIDIALWRADVEGETAAARVTDLFDIQDAVRSGMLALRGGASALARFRIEPGEPVQFSATGPQRGKSMIMQSLRWRG